MHERWPDVVGTLLGSAVRSAATVHGGDVARAARVVLADGRVVFAKTRDRPPPACFLTEAAGLQWLREVGTVPVPEVLAATDGTGPSDEGPIAVLVLEWIDEGPRSRADEARFGRSLAALHRAGAQVFGRTDRATTGSRSLPNEPCATWAAHYGDQRLRPLAAMARVERAVAPHVLDAVERIASRLDEVAGADEPAARLHGDLWAGNRLVDVDGASWLVDPAAFGGHREFDLAMMRLFGGFGDAAFAAYTAEHPLAPGWESRVPLHQLAPLLVHAIKFGGGYAAAAARAVEALGPLGR